MLDKDAIKTIESIIQTGDECIVKIERGNIVILHTARRLKFKNPIENKNNGDNN